MALKEHNFKVPVVVKKPTKSVPKKGDLQNVGAGIHAPNSIDLSSITDWPPQILGSRPSSAGFRSRRSQQISSRPTTTSLPQRPSTAQDRFLQRYSLKTCRPQSSGFTGIVRDFNISRYPPPNVFGRRSLSSSAWRSVPPTPRPNTAPAAVTTSKTSKASSRAVSPGAISPYAVRYPKAILCTPRVSPKAPATEKPRRKRSASELAPNLQVESHPRVYAVHSEASERTTLSRRSQLDSGVSTQPRKFRKSLWADELNFVVTDDGLKDPGSPSRPKHWSDTEGVYFSEPGRARAAYFDPTASGSYPPRPPELETFSDLKYHHLHRCKVEDIAEMMMILKPDPETDVQPVAAGPMPGLSWVDVYRVPRKLTLPLELFDYPEMDLRHPSHDILKVRSLSHPSQFFIVHV